MRTFGRGLRGCRDSKRFKSTVAGLFLPCLEKWSGVRGGEVLSISGVLQDMLCGIDFLGGIDDFFMDRSLVNLYFDVFMERSDCYVTLPGNNSHDYNFRRALHENRTFVKLRNSSHPRHGT